jgi:hypothetical protein
VQAVAEVGVMQLAIPLVQAGVPAVFHQNLLAQVAQVTVVPEAEQERQFAGQALQAPFTI